MLVLIYILIIVVQLLCYVDRICYTCVAALQGLDDKGNKVGEMGVVRSLSKTTTFYSLQIRTKKLISCWNVCSSLFRCCITEVTEPPKGSTEIEVTQQNAHHIATSIINNAWRRKNQNAQTLSLR